MKLTKRTLLLAFLLFGGLFSCDSSKKENQSTQREKAYESFVIRPVDMHGNISLPGELKSFESVEIYPKTTGYVQNVKVDRGSRINKGDILAHIEAPEIMAALAVTKAKVLQAEGVAQSADSKLATVRDQYERIKKTAQIPGAVSAADLLRVENQLKEEEANTAAAASALEATRFEWQAAQQMANYLTIRAPFDGIVTERNVHTGTFVDHQVTDKPMFKLEMNTLLRLEVPIPESYAGFDFGSDSLTFTLSSQAGKSLKAMVARQSGSLQNATRTEIIEADIPNHEGKLKAGSFAQVEVPYHKTEAMVIPSAALVTSMEDRFVVKVVNGEAQRISVRKGISQDGQTEIFGPLQPGDTILKNPSETIQNGDRVRIE